MFCEITELSVNGILPGSAASVDAVRGGSADFIEIHLESEGRDEDVGMEP